MISLKMRTLTMTMPSAIAATPPIRKPSSVSSVVSQTCCGNHGAVNRITSPSQTRLGAGRTSGDTSSARQAISHSTMTMTSSEATAPPRGSSGHPQVLSYFERLARELRRFHEVDRARPRQRHVDHREHPPGHGVHDDDAIGEKHRLADAVRDEDDRLAALLPDAQQLEVHPLPRELVERSERLVHEDDRRVDHQHPAERGALLHAARELARVRAFAALEPHEPQDVARFLGGGAALEPEDLDRQQHVLEDGAPREEHRRLEHHPDAPARPGDPRRTDADVPGAGVEQPADQLEQRRLAAAARPDESDELPGQDLHADLAQRFERDRALGGESLADVADRDRAEHQPGAVIFTLPLA